MSLGISNITPSYTSNKQMSTPELTFHRPAVFAEIRLLGDLQRNTVSSFITSMLNSGTSSTT